MQTTLLRGLVSRRAATLRATLVWALGAFLALAALCRTSAAEVFTGAPAFPLKDAMWIVVDAGASGSGISEDAEAAARFAQKTLGLEVGRSLLRFASTTTDVRHLEGEFRLGGRVGRRILVDKPAVIVLLVLGASGDDGVAYGDETLSPDWLGKRLADLRAVARDALIVSVIDSCGATAEEILSKAGPGLSPVEVWTTPQRLSEPGRGTLAPLLISALAGAADDRDGGGYDVLEVRTYVEGAYPRLARKAGVKEDLSIVPAWNVDAEAHSRRFPLKRRRYAVGVCFVSPAPLPAEPGETRDQRLERSARAARGLAETAARSFADAAKAAGDPAAIHAELFDGAKLGGAARACDEVPSRQEHDLWIRLLHRIDSPGRYTFSVVDVRTDEARITDQPAPYLDHAAAKEALATLADKLFEPRPVQAPPRETASTEKRSGTLFLIDRSESNSAHGYGSDPSGANRTAAVSTLLDLERLRCSGSLGQCVPIAIVTFGNTARALSDGGKHWFSATDGDVSRIRSVLPDALSDDEQTNLGAALELAGALAKEKPEVTTWHVFMMTDGVPTLGIRDYDAIARAAKQALGGRGILTVLTLSGRDASYASRRELHRLAEAVSDGAGARGATFDVPTEDTERAWMAQLLGVGAEHTGGTVRGEVRIPCKRKSRASLLMCEAEELNLGSLRTTTFAIAGAFGDGACQLSLENGSMSPPFVNLALPAKTPSMETRIESGLRVKLTRGQEGLFLELEAERGSLDGAWTIRVQAALPADQASPP